MTKRTVNTDDSAGDATINDVLDFQDFMSMLNGIGPTEHSEGDLLASSATIYAAFIANKAFDKGEDGAVAAGMVEQGTPVAGEPTVSFTTEQLEELVREVFSKGAKWEKNGQEPIRPDNELSGQGGDLSDLIADDDELRRSLNAPTSEAIED